MTAMRPGHAALANFERMLASGKDGALLRFSLGNEYLKAGDAATRRRASAARGRARSGLHGRVEAARPRARRRRPRTTKRSRPIATASRSRERKGDKQAEQGNGRVRAADRERADAPSQRCAPPAHALGWPARRRARCPRRRRGPSPSASVTRWRAASVVELAPQIRVLHRLAGRRSSSRCASSRGSSVSMPFFTYCESV